MAMPTPTGTASRAEADSHFKRIFDLSPIPTWEQDYTEVTEVLDRLRAEGVTDLMRHLRKHRDVLLELVAAVSVRHANRAALETYQYDPAKNGGRITLHSEGSLETFCHQVAAVWNGDSELHYEFNRDSVYPGPKQCALHWHASERGGRPDYTSVILVIADIGGRQSLTEQLQRRAAQLELLQDVNREIASQLSLDVVLQTIVDGVKRILDAKWVELLILDPALEEVVERNTVGLKGKLTSAAELHAGIGGWVLREQVPSISASAQGDPRNTGRAMQRANEEGVGPLVIAPLTINGVTRGTIAAGRMYGDAVFTQPDLGVLGLMAAHASFAVANAMSVEQIESEIASRDRLAAAVSHELRTPLTSVTGLARALSDDWDGMDDIERRELIAVISRESTDALEIVEDLLLTARVDLGQVGLKSQPIDLHAQAASVLNSLEDRHSHEIELSGDPVTVSGDPVRVRQVLRNLITNAIRYGGDTISVVIETGVDFGLVRVIDNGSGVDPEVESALFTDFAKGSADLPASVGLGLSVSKNIAEAMGGALAYERRDQLTDFWLRLPRG